MQQRPKMRVHFSRRTAAITIWRASRFPADVERAIDATKLTCEVFPDSNTLCFFAWVLWLVVHLRSILG
ncbi:hypothetical protein, partial [Senegalimassilia anaerobia]|uniref:hypothetical protein n=1 Tax=Senegalimassilia anaerobia TaxID=1473216 RepID=UPI00248D9E51